MILLGHNVIYLTHECKGNKSNLNSQMDMGRAVGGVFVTKNLLGPHYEIVGQACLANIHSGKTNLETVDFNILEADAKAEIRFR